MRRLLQVLAVAVAPLTIAWWMAKVALMPGTAHPVLAWGFAGGLVVCSAWVGSVVWREGGGA